MSNKNNEVLAAICAENWNTVRDLLDTCEYTDGYALLCTALNKKQSEIAMLLLDKGCNVNKDSFKPSNTPLHHAARNGDLEIVKVLIERGAYINATNAEQKTPLHLAIENAKINVIEFLLQSGASPNINAKSSDGSPLHVAICFKMKSLPMVELLLDYKADINCSGSGKNHYPKRLTPLHLATAYGNDEIVKLLLKRGAVVDSRAKHDITPLHTAVKKGHLKITKYLLDHGASINFADGLRGHTALHLAIIGGNEKLVTLLLQNGGNVNTKDKTNKTPIHLAADKGKLSIIDEILKFHPDIDDGNNRDIFNFAIRSKNLATIETLLKYGFSLNIKEKNNLLFYAIKEGYLIIVKSLLDSCPDINGLYYLPNDRNFISLYNSVSEEAHTPLHCAVKNKQEKVVELLINYGFDVNIKDEAGYPPIFYAIENSNFEITKLLLNRGIDIHSIQHKFQLLNVAVKNECKEIIRILLQYGIDVNAADEHGKTALHFAVSGQDEKSIQFFYNCNDNKNNDVKVEIVKLLLQHQAYVDAETDTGVKALHTAIENGHVEMVEVLLEHGANVNSRSRRGSTPLHIAVRVGNKIILTKLLDKGADVNAISENGMTALHIATQTGHEEIVEILLKYGIQIDSKTGRSTTPLHIAAKQGHLNIIKILLQYGADVNSRNEYGATALHITSIEGHEHIVMRLIDDGCDINIVTDKNYTPLDFAIASMNLFNDRSTIADVYNEYYGTNSDGLGCRCNSGIAIIKILKMQIIRLKTAKLYVNERNLFLINESVTSELCNFQKFCEKEIEQMKNEKINNDNISFYDVLTKSKFGMYTKNDNVKQTLQSETYKLKFPIYGKIVYFNFLIGIERKKLLEKSIECFYSLFTVAAPLPYNCTENIFKFMCSKNLRYFINVCEIVKTNNTNNTGNTDDTSKCK